MFVSRPSGAPWHLEDVNAKLALRAGLPGARVFDLAADGLRKAKTAGLPAGDRLALALPASWCVNSPADSRTFRRWVLPPQREVWLALVDLLEEAQTAPLDTESTEAVVVGIRALAPDPTSVEAVSKALALLVPDVVPLMPPAACAFVLGHKTPADATAFVAMIDWFLHATESAQTELSSWAAAHREVPLSGPQVLDRLLWFDSDGGRHFPPSKTDRGGEPHA